ncbi:MAG: cytochrome c biogenesis protein CcsA [Prevotella sp.]|nr:cytochrome c biogenesis protein CcsA [Prevotella sp.]MCM1075270.1 cytochrome c biogenesis protein CcsA [Ruminococcus sp.]
MKRKPFTFLIHIALAIIVVGAIVTHFLGIQGEVTLKIEGEPTTEFKKSSGPGDAKLPFSIAVKEADIDFYPGTTTPMDFHSLLLIDGCEVPVSMNKVGEYSNWRFYQSGMTPDSSTLAVSHDPWGTGITYTGYVLLGIALIGYFFQKKTPWRSLLRKPLAALLFMACAATTSAAETELPCMQRPLAANLGKVYVYWNDRICPMQTMAQDVTAKLYKSASYKGMTAEQVLSGWLFYYDAWQQDYNLSHDDITEQTDTPNKKQKEEAERRALIRWLGTGEAFKIYPYIATDGHTEWLSLTGRRPSQMCLEQWKFMQTTMPRMQMLLLSGKNIAANSLIDTLIQKQKYYAGEQNLPTELKMNAERYYNKTASPLVAALIALILSIIYLYISLRNLSNRKLMILANAVLWLLLVYLTAMLGMHWWIGSHIPVSNGPETMLFMALCALLGAVICHNGMLRGALTAVAAMSLFVATMAGRTPQIGSLMPVLASPLLSIHVMLVMTSYVLFMLMAILSAIALIGKNELRAKELCRINRIILLPAVFLLTAGIFVGAVWANQSWGRYWGWDPKETCALITMLVYSLPLHWASPRLSCFRCPRILHFYLLLAIITVLFTYFGANYLLPGLHSYA